MFRWLSADPVGDASRVVEENQAAAAAIDANAGSEEHGGPRLGELPPPPVFPQDIFARPVPREFGTINEKLDSWKIPEDPYITG